MSLKDTIEGARREVQGNVISRSKKEAEAAPAEEEKKGFSRSSAAKAKPAREAAASVRPTAKQPSSGGLFGGSSESKEQKQERRRKEREADDLRNRAYDLVLRSLPGYGKTEKVFWVTTGAGLALGVITLIMTYAFGEQTDVSTWQGMVSVGALVAAYACIFGGIIYDFVKRRPLRKQAQARLSGLSDKKLLELIEHDRKERAKSGEKR